MTTVRLAPIALALGLAANPLPGQERCEADWRLEETLRVGSFDGSVLEMTASGVEIGADGRIYVTQSQTPHVLVLDSEGRLLRRVGRAGEGPGEFQFGAGGMGWIGDTLWVGDIRKIHYFGEDESEIRQVTFRRLVPNPPDQYRITTAFPAVDGTLIGYDFDVYGGIERGYHPIVRLSMDGELLNEIVRVSVPGRYIESEALGIFNSPFWPLPLPIVDPAGREVLLVEAERDPPRDATFRIVRIGLDGDTLMAWPIPYEPIRVTRRAADQMITDYADFRTANRGVFETETPARIRERIFEEVTAPDYHMPVRRMVAGHDGSVWLLRELGPDRGDRWEVYSPEGELEGVVEVTTGRSSPFPGAPRLWIIRATRSEVWGGTIDELEVPYLHRFAVQSSCQ